MLSFLQPVYLWAAGAATLPLLLHLMQRRRTIRIPFSTLRFLKLANKRSSRRIRLEHFLLWLLRTLILLLLALAFAAPVLRTEQLGALTGHSQRDVAVVWDVSYSTTYESREQSVWKAGRDTLEAMLKGLRKGDRVCIFLAGEDPEPLLAQLTPDLDLAVSLVKAQSPRNTSSQLAGATAAACRVLREAARGERELYLISDGQALPWNDFRTPQSAAPEGAPDEGAPSAARERPGWDPELLDERTTIFVALVGPGTPQNVAPLNMEIQPEVLMADVPAKAAARLGCTGPVEDTPVTLVVSESAISRQTAPLSEGGEGSVLFALPPLAAGIHTARVQTPPDALVADDTFYFLLRVKQRLDVLCAGTLEDTFFLMKALDPGGGVSGVNARRVEASALAAEPLHEYACLFLCNALPLDGQVLMAVERYVRNGGLLVVFPGDRASPDDYRNVSCLPAPPVEVRDVPPLERRCFLRLLASSDPIFLSLRLPPGSVPAVVIQRELRWDLTDSEAEELVVSEARRPFLLGRDFGKGRVLMVAVSADRQWSTLPLTAFFLPLAHQIAHFGARQAAERPFYWAAHEVFLDHPQWPEGASLLSPAGETIPVIPIRGGQDTVLRVENLFEPGVYRMLAAAGDPGEPVLAVNLRREESNLNPIQTHEIQALLRARNLHVARSQEELERLVQAHRIGRPLAEQALWAVLLLSAAELFLANRGGRKTTTLSEELVVDPSGRVHGLRHHAGAEGS